MFLVPERPQHRNMARLALAVLAALTATLAHAQKGIQYSRTVTPPKNANGPRGTRFTRIPPHHGPAFLPSINQCSSGLSDRRPLTPSPPAISVHRVPRHHPGV